MNWGLIMKKSFLFGGFILIISIFLSGCSEQPTDTNDPDILNVYTTVYPLEYFTETIGGSYVQVESIYPPGADEHTFEPSQKDMIKLAESDLFIFIGLGLEGFVEKAKGTLKNEDVAMLAAGESIRFEDSTNHQGENQEEASHEDENYEDAAHGETEHEQGHAHGDIDPHVWIDPIYAKDLAVAIKDQLIVELPSHEETFNKNYQALIDDLDKLNSQFNAMVTTAKHHEMIVSHSAYGYWEERYGIEQISISGMSTTSEPSQKELQNLIDHGKKAGLKYVLFEQNFQSRLGEAVQNELGAKSLTLHNLSVLTEEDVSNGETYFSLMEKNLETLKIALNN